MKIKFTTSPKGRPEFKAGDILDFKGPVPETYANKFIARGWAEPYDDAAIKATEKARAKADADAQAEAAAREKEKAEAEARIKAAADVKNKTGGANPT